MIMFTISRDGLVTIRPDDGAEISISVEDFVTLEPGFIYTPQKFEYWSPKKTYLSCGHSQTASPYNRADYLAPDKIEAYRLALTEPEPEPEPELEPQPEVDPESWEEVERKFLAWQQFALTMNSNMEWLELVDTGGVAAEMARYASMGDLANTRTYYQFLNNKGRLTGTLKAAIAQAATDANLTAELAIVTGQS